MRYLLLLKALHEPVVPWFLSYLPNWRGGSGGIRNRRIRVEVAVGVCFVVEDANDLSRFYHEAPVVVREEGTLTEEVVCARATGLFA